MKTPSATLLLPIAVASLSACVLGQPTYVVYVEPATTPPNPVQNGTLQNPYNTLEAARDHVRNDPARYSAHWRVRLKANSQGYRRFYLNQPFVLDPQDSAGNGLQIIYEANPISATTWDDVLITGGRPINNPWTHIGSSIWTTIVADAPADGFRDLYLNNWRLTRARWPNRAADGSPQFTRITFASNYTPWPYRYYRIEQSFNPPLGPFEPVELVTRFAWLSPRQVISHIQQNTNGFSTFYFHHTQPIGWSAPCGAASDPYAASNLQVRGRHGQDTMAVSDPPGQYGSPPLDGPCNRGTAVFVENSYSFIDQCYEWFFDTASQQLYLKLPAGINPNNYAPNSFMYPRIDALVHLRRQGTAAVYGVFFTRLNFGFSALPMPRTNAKPDNAPQYDCAGQPWLSQAKPGYLSGYSGQGQAPYVENGLITRAAIYLEETESCGINHCRIAHTGGSAIAVNGIGNRIMGNKVFDVGGTAVFVGNQGVLSSAQGDPLSWTTLGYSNQIRFNTIADYGQVYFDNAGIRVLAQADLTVSNNWITRGGFSGISLGSCNSNVYCQFGQTNNVLTANRIDDVCRVLADAAGIYITGSIGSSTISNNWIRSTLADSTHDYRFFGTAGIYFDEGATGAWRLGGNVLENTYRACVPCDNSNAASAPRRPWAYPIFFNVSGSDPTQRPNPCTSSPQTFDWYAPNYSDVTPVRLWSSSGAPWACDVFGGCILPSVVSTTDPANQPAVNAIKSASGIGSGYSVYWPYMAVSPLLEPPGSTATGLPPPSPSCP